LAVDDPALLLLARGERFVAVFNFADHPRPWPAGALADDRIWTNVLTGMPFGAEVQIPGGSMLWLTAA